MAIMANLMAARVAEYPWASNVIPQFFFKKKKRKKKEIALYFGLQLPTNSKNKRLNASLKFVQAQRLCHAL